MKNWNVLHQEIIALLKEKLAPHLTYHNWQHTEHVIAMTEFIARQEKVSESEILLLKTAALFHDIGFINAIEEGHENESIRLAKEKLPHYGYNKAEIKAITGMIKATEIPQMPKNRYECIIADADLEYLGTDRFESIGHQLFLELKATRPSLSRSEWNSIQINFLQSHFYKTDYCKQFRAPLKEKNIQKLMVPKAKPQVSNV
jgi:uncharacterized protein